MKIAKTYLFLILFQVLARTHAHDVITVSDIHAYQEQLDLSSEAAEILKDIDSDVGIEKDFEKEGNQEPEEDLNDEIAEVLALDGDESEHDCDPEGDGHDDDLDDENDFDDDTNDDDFEDPTDEELEKKYEEFLVKYEKNYKHEEKQKRLEMFKTQVKENYRFNREGHTWRKGVNFYTDLSHEERFELVKTEAPKNDGSPNETNALRNELNSIRLQNYLSNQDSFVSEYRLTLRQRIENLLSIIRRIRSKIRYIRLKIIRLRRMIRRLRALILILARLLRRLLQFGSLYASLIRRIILRLRYLIARLRRLLWLLRRCIYHLRRCLRLLRYYLAILRRLFQLHWDRIIFILLTRNICQNRDWATAGKVTSVKNQGGCGSCWAFAAVALVESAFLIYNNVYTDLSEKELVHCSKNNGCNGGWMYTALNNYVKPRGLVSEPQFPYTPTDIPDASQCAVPNVNTKYFVTNVGRVGQNNSVSFLRKLCETPLTVAFLARGDFFDYESGIYDGEDCEGQQSINHGVLAVGHSLTAAVPYVKFKNSWGAGWGDNGYFKMKLEEKVTSWNTCNMLKYSADYVESPHYSSVNTPAGVNDSTDTLDVFPGANR